jgi:hypothetical protein
MAGIVFPSFKDAAISADSRTKSHWHHPDEAGGAQSRGVGRVRARSVADRGTTQ